MGSRPIKHKCLNSVLNLNVKALVGAFNQEKALAGAFSVIVQPVLEPMDRFAALDVTVTITLLPSLSFYHPSTKHLSTPFISVTLTPATLSTPSSENWSPDVS